jgi:predicted ester cyclase
MADPRQVAAKFMEAFNAHDESGMREVTAEDATFEAPGDVSLRGRDATTEYALVWLRAFPNAKATVQNELVDGDWVVQEFIFEGDHEDTLAAPTGEIPATHRHLRGRAVQILRIDGDAVADTRLYFDQVQVMTQLGLMPETVTA